MAKKNKKIEIFTNGLIKENPVLRLVLGTCSTLALTTVALNGLTMGAIVIFVLVCSNTVISLLRKVIPNQVRIPAYITIIAGFVTIIQLLLQAYLPALHEVMGIYLPLVAVNCIILGRAESFAGKNPVIPSILDGLGMGIGFTAALVLMGAIRELIGNGTIFGLTVTANIMEPMLIIILPPGGFFVFGLLIALSNKITNKKFSGVGTFDTCRNCSSSEFCDYCKMKGGT